MVLHCQTKKKLHGVFFWQVEENKAPHSRKKVSSHANESLDNSPKERTGKALGSSRCAGIYTQTTSTREGRSSPLAALAQWWLSLHGIFPLKQPPRHQKGNVYHIKDYSHKLPPEYNIISQEIRHQISSDRDLSLSLPFFPVSSCFFFLQKDCRNQLGKKPVKLSRDRFSAVGPQFFRRHFPKLHFYKTKPFSWHFVVLATFDEKEDRMNAW